jgi:hypothetical protein
MYSMIIMPIVASSETLRSKLAHFKEGLLGVHSLI